ncbi:MAG: hypothetical protein K1Y36_10725 [Blastocatellia bacterium]|nr:hypothetical protein [Blastocatellia bacterium]
MYQIFRWLMVGIVLLAGIPVWAQSTNGTNTGKATELYRYQFEREGFEIPKIEVEVNDKGHGKLLYEKKGETEPVTADLELRPETVSRIQALLAKLDFVNSTDEYLSSMDHPTLGVTIFDIRQGDRKRALTFTYTSNVPLQQLAVLFRGLALQNERLEALNLTRRFQPLDGPKLMRDLEGDFKANRIAEPIVFLPILKSCVDDERLPLIARNHAKRLAEQIEKAK